MRLYDANSGQWNVVYMSMFPRLDNRTWIGGKKGEDMVLDLEIPLQDGSTGIQRLSFYNIKADSFDWKGEIVRADSTSIFWQLGCTRSQ